MSLSTLFLCAHCCWYLWTTCFDYKLVVFTIAGVLRITRHRAQCCEEWICMGSTVLYRKLYRCIGGSDGSWQGLRRGDPWPERDPRVARHVQYVFVDTFMLQSMSVSHWQNMRDNHKSDRGVFLYSVYGITYEWTCLCVFNSLYHMLLITTVTTITAVATTVPILLMLLREYYKYSNTNSRASTCTNSAADYHYRSANWADAVPRPAVVISKVCPGTVNSLWREPQSGWHSNPGTEWPFHSVCKVWKLVNAVQS